MIFVSDLMWAIDIMLHPNKTTKSWSIGSAIVQYWKVAVIPMLILIILAYALSSLFKSVLSFIFGTAGALVGGLLGAYLIVAILVAYLILIPIGLLIAAIFIHIVGRLLGVFKGGYNATFSALVYGILPWLVLSWIPFISILGSIWGIVVEIFALSNLQKTTKLMAFVAWIGGAILLAIIYFIIGAVLRLGLGAATLGTVPGSGAPKTWG